MEWVTEFSAWLAGLVQSFLEVVVHIFSFLVILVIDFLATVIAAALNGITLPFALTSNSLNSLMGAMPAGVGYMFTAVKLDVVVGIIVSAVLVRLLRKVVTLFQW